MTYFNNLERLPSRETFERFREEGLTSYTYDEVIAAAEAADDANRRWQEAIERASSFLPQKTIFFMSLEELERDERISTLSQKHREVSVFGAKRHSVEMYPLKTAQKDVARLERGIKAMNTLALEFEQQFV